MIPNYEKEYQKALEWYCNEYATTLYDYPIKPSKYQETQFRAGYYLARIQQEGNEKEIIKFIKEKRNEEAKK